MQFLVRLGSLMVMKKTFVFILAMAFFQPAYAKNLDKAFVHMQANEYTQASKIAQKLLDDLQLNTIDDISLAHKILGVSSCQTGNEEKALSHFETLKTFSPNAKLDGIALTNRCQKLFTTMKLEENKKRRKKSVPKKQTSSYASTPAENLSYQSDVKTPSNRYIPFGVGQFRNGEKKKGLAFLIGQSVLYSAGITALAIHGSDANKGLRDAGIGSLAAGGFVSLWGILDAVQTYKKSQ